MNRAKALQTLARAKPELARRYGVVRLALFGSTARDEARPDCDVDIMVSFDGPATSLKKNAVGVNNAIAHDQRKISPRK